MIVNQHKIDITHNRPDFFLLTQYETAVPYLPYL